MSEVVKPGEVNQEEVNRFTKVFAPILEDGKPSVGRIMLVSTFFLAVWKWYGGAEIPQTQLTIMITLIGYVISSKAVGTVKDVAQKIKDSKEIVANIKR